MESDVTAYGLLRPLGLGAVWLLGRLLRGRDQDNADLEPRARRGRGRRAVRARRRLPRDADAHVPPRVARPGQPCCPSPGSACPKSTAIY